jgi:hypothetical protein
MIKIDIVPIRGMVTVTAQARVMVARRLMTGGAQASLEMIVIVITPAIDAMATRAFQSVMATWCVAAMTGRAVGNINMCKLD